MLCLLQYSGWESPDLNHWHQMTSPGKFGPIRAQTVALWSEGEQCWPQKTRATLISSNINCPRWEHQQMVEGEFLHLHWTEHHLLLHNHPPLISVCRADQRGSTFISQSWENFWKLKNYIHQLWGKENMLLIISWWISVILLQEMLC